MQETDLPATNAFKGKRASGGKSSVSRQQRHPPVTHMRYAFSQRLPQLPVLPSTGRRSGGLRACFSVCLQ